MANSASVTICADDYAYSPATSATILSLLDGERINATSCLVETAHWASDGVALRQFEEHKPTIAIGLHLNLTERFEDRLASARMTPLRLLLDRSDDFTNDLRNRFATQWSAFVEVMGRAPDFVDGHQHVHLAPSARDALFQLLSNVGFNGWLRQCRTSSSRPGLKRLVLDGLSDRFRRGANNYGWRCNPGFGGLRSFRMTEDIATHWRRDLSAMHNGGLLMVHPGVRVCGDPIGPCREQEAQALAAGAVTCALMDFGLVLAQAGPSSW